MLQEDDDDSDTPEETTLENQAAETEEKVQAVEKTEEKLMQTYMNAVEGRAGLTTFTLISWIGGRRAS